jgi:hypothetical protein
MMNHNSSNQKQRDSMQLGTTIEILTTGQLASLSHSKFLGSTITSSAC